MENYILICFRLKLGVYASAVVLSVEVIFLRKLDRAFVAVFLFEVAEEPLRFVVAFKGFADAVEALRILVWADGKGGGKVIVAVFYRFFIGFFEAKLVAVGAPCPPFG